MKIGPGVSELWGIENRPILLTWHIATLVRLFYTTACILYTVQAVMTLLNVNKQSIDTRTTSL